MSPMRFIKSLSISIPKRDYIPTRNQEIETIRNIIRFFDNETKNENNCCKSIDCKFSLDKSYCTRPKCMYFRDDKVMNRDIHVIISCTPLLFPPFSR